MSWKQGCGQVVVKDLHIIMFKTTPAMLKRKRVVYTRTNSQTELVGKSLSLVTVVEYLTVLLVYKFVLMTGHDKWPGPANLGHTYNTDNLTVACNTLFVIYNLYD